MSYVTPTDFARKMIDAGEAKVFMSTKDTLIRAYMAGAILALAAAFAVTVTVNTGDPLIGALLFLIWRMWNQFHERSIEPRTRRAGRVIEHIDARADAAQAEVVANTRKAAGRMRNWVDSWRGPRSR